MLQIDAVGNLRALYPAAEPAASRLLIGSHLDTVPNAGAFDGILGVVLAIALLKGLNGRRLPYAIEVVGFSDEEGVRFATPFLGSRALVSRFDDNLMERQDSQGISVRKAIQDFGLNPERIGDAMLGDDVCAYLEFHIEQGPVLESLALPLGVVDAVAGQSRFEFIFKGRANHAGTTPMNMRFDALSGAAEWIAAVEHMARSDLGLVATVGAVQTKPGAVNVIAGEARLSLDVRHPGDDIRMRAVEDLIRHAQAIARRRGLTVGWNEHMNQRAVQMDLDLITQIEEAIRKSGCKPHRMVSGAGHDAMILAEKVPSGIVFIRTPGGISHDPAESVPVDDVAMAIECGSHLLDQFAVSSAFQKRTCRA
jgi:allantoate deiminase